MVKFQNFSIKIQKIFQQDIYRETITKHYTTMADLILAYHKEN